MKKSTLILAGILTLGIALVGCNGNGEAADATTTDTSSATTSSDTGDADMKTATTDATMVQCDKCGMDMAKADAHEHDGKTVCEHCIESS